LIKENLKNIIIYSFGQILPRALTFFFTLYLARILGKDEFGKYDFAISIGYTIGIFFELGGNPILTKYVARGFFSAFRFSISIRVASIIIFTILTFLFFWIIGLYKDVYFHILIATLGIGFSSLMNMNFAFFRGLKKINYEVIVLIIQKVLFIGLCLLFFIQSKNSITALSSFAVSMLVSFIIMQSIYLSKRKEYTDTSDYKIKFNEYIKDVLSLGLVEVFTIIYFRIPQIFLEKFWGFGEVGVYGASYKFIEVLTTIPSILMILLFPNFARLAVENIASFIKYFKKILLYFSVFGIIAAIGCWVFGKYFLSFIGKDYSEAYILLRYMTLALIFIYPNYLITQSLIALDRNLKYALVVFSALVINVIASALIVPDFGVYGSALLIGVCEALMFGFALIIIFKEFKLRKALVK